MTARHEGQNAVVLVGTGRFADPWHDFRGSGAAVAAALHSMGLVTQVRELSPESLADLDAADLVVVNAGYDRSVGERPLGPEWDDGFAALSRYIHDGGPLLALHATAAAFRNVTGGRDWIGGSWIDGLSMHPPKTRDRVDLDRTHPITASRTAFETLDEMYCFLEVAPHAEVFARYELHDMTHPLAWTSHADGRRVVYNALGHDARAYESAGRRELLAAEVDWLLGQHR